MGLQSSPSLGSDPPTSLPIHLWAYGAPQLVATMDRGKLILRKATQVLGCGLTSPVRAMMCISEPITLGASGIKYFYWVQGHIPTLIGKGEGKSFPNTWIESREEVVPK